jgi:3',5'-cyclic AMP phosphodiesterase CpdA/Tfp pilus assembly protein PilF
MPKLFVIMPFGERQAAPQHGVTKLNFEHIYPTLIRGAGEDALWEVLRIDEVHAPGNITDQYLSELFAADLVVADISIPNGNVYYELGIRQAISSGGTVLIACKGTPIPFDLNQQRVLFYEPSDEGLLQARAKLALAIRSHQLPGTNPIRTFLEKLGLTSSPAQDTTAFEQEFRGRIERAKNAEQLIAVWHWAQHLSPLPAPPLLNLAERLSQAGEWATSVEVLRRAVQVRPQDFEINRQLGWHLRNLGPDSWNEAFSYFENALRLNPDDPETLGMAGGLRKRQQRYAEALQFYTKGATLSPRSTYMRVNEAALAILADPTRSDRGVGLYKQLIESIRNDSSLASDAWADLVLAEAYFAIGDNPLARQHIEQALQTAATPNSLRSLQEQIQLLGEAGYRTSEAKTLTDWVSEFLSNYNQRTPTALQVSHRAPAPTPPIASLPVFIHLSDIHFGKRPGKNGLPEEMHRFFESDWNKSLSEHLHDEFSAPDSHFKNIARDRFHLIISGDLTYTAEPNEFTRVLEFLEQVCGTLKIPKERVLLVPGNHDVHWPSAKMDLARRFDHYIVFLVRFYGEELFRKRYPLLKWTLRVDDPRPKPNELIALYPGDGFTLVGLNSCVYETDQNHYGFIGGRQLDHVSKLLAEHAPTQKVRIAVMHHHLHPFPEALMPPTHEGEVWQDLSTIRDAGLVERRLERLGFDLVLHGHKHKAQIRETLVRDRSEPLIKLSRLFVLGAGSTGVSEAELHHNDANHYELIELLQTPRVENAAFLRLEWRELALTPGAEWATSGEWILVG